MVIGLMATTATAIVPTASTAIGAMAITGAIGLIVGTGRAVLIGGGADGRVQTVSELHRSTIVESLAS
jgi:hypothetical protein